MSQYLRFGHLSHVPRLRLACAFLKFHQNFPCSHTLSMDVDKTRPHFRPQAGGGGGGGGGVLEVRN